MFTIPNIRWRRGEHKITIRWMWVSYGLRELTEGDDRPESVGQPAVPRLRKKKAREKKRRRKKKAG